MDKYLGNDVNLKFDSLIDGKYVKPLNVKLAAYAPNGDFLGYGQAKIDNKEVRGIIPYEKITKLGNYTAIFYVNLPNVGEQKHIVKFKVKKLPVSNKIEKQLVNT